MSEVTSLFELLKRRTQQAATGQEMIEAGRVGRLHKIRDYLRVHKNHEHVIEDEARFVLDMLAEPQEHPRKAEATAVLFDNSFSAKAFFEKVTNLYPRFEEQLWTAYSKDPNEDTAKAAGMLASEYFKARCLLDDKSYAPPLRQLLPSVDGAAQIHEEKREKITKSIIATQNALVEYVSSEGSTLPINRGAGMLNLFNDVAGAEWWTRKLTNIRTAKVEHLQKGEILVLKPVFE